MDPILRKRPVRRRIYEILEEGTVGDAVSVAADRLLIILIIVNVIAVVLETVGSLERAYGHLFLAIEYASVTIFTVEYVLRLWVADLGVVARGRGPWAARLSYALRPSAVIDLLAILPFYVGIFISVGDWRYLRLFRLVRFLKLARYSPALGSLLLALSSEVRALLAAVVIMLGLVLTAASALYIVEHEVQPDSFGSIPQAMWWAVATLTTVGYGDVVPLTILGKIIGGVVMVFGLGMFAIPIGIVATAFVQQIHRRDFVVNWGMVAKVPLFADLTASEIAEVMKLLDARMVEPGDMITRKGEEARSMFIIAAGSVEVQLGDHTVTLGDGAFFGEIAVLHKARRVATVRALERTRLLVLDAADLHQLMERQPKIASHIKAVARDRLGKEALTPHGDIAIEEVEPGNP